MAEERKPANGVLASSIAVSPGEALFQRRIEFHPARKPFSPAANSHGDFRVETLNPSSDSHMQAANGVPAGLAKRSDGVELRERKLDPEITFNFTVRRIGAGLENLGNTCFLNSVLQCLTYTEPFAAYLQSGRHKSSCHTAGFCAMCALQNHVMTALKSTGKILSPSHLVKNLRCISRNFRSYRQEDAHEYMVNLLESMHKCCLPSGVPSESPSAYEKSLVHKIFGGRLRSQVECMECHYSSNKFDPFLDLSLEIVKADSVHKALSHFTAFEKLDGGERQYQCQRCKQKVRAIKRLTVHKAPYVLTIHLKRFGSAIPGQKIDRRVRFEPNLDLKPFVSDPEEGDLKYTLYGVLVHAGYTTHSGHYFCYIRTSTGLWYSLNDNQVSQVSEKNVLDQKAYMLFYIRNRTSPKKAFEIIRNENNYKNVPANGVIMSHCIKETTQTGPGEKRLCTSENHTLISRLLANDKPDSVKVVSSVDSLVNKTSLLQKPEQLSPKAQSNGVTLDHSLAGVTELDFTEEKNGQVIARNSILYLPKANGDEPIADVSLRPTNSGDKVSGENISTSIAQQNKHNGCTISLNLHNTENDNMSCKESSHGRHEKIIARHLADDDVPIQRKTLGLTSAAKQDYDANKKYKRDTIGDSAGSIVTKQVTSLDISTQHIIANDRLEKEVPQEGSVTDSRYADNETDVKPLKQKHSYMKTMHFGPRQLFFASLHLSKKRQKRNKNRCLRTKSSMKTSFSCDKETSTSEMINVSRMQMNNSEQKQPSSSKKESSNGNSNKENGVLSKRGHKYSNGIDSNKNGDSEVRNVENIAVLATARQPEASINLNASRGSITEMDVHERNAAQSGLMSMLLRGLTEPTLPKWNDIELPSAQIHDLKSEQKRNIGYVLNEWDEEYDRPKRKKVKRNNQLSGSSLNLFKEIADRSTQETLERKRSGNQPLRI